MISPRRVPFLRCASLAFFLTTKQMCEINAQALCCQIKKAMLQNHLVLATAMLAIVIALAIPKHNLHEAIWQIKPTDSSTCKIIATMC